MLEDYKNALKSGQRAYRACVARGQSPYLAVLDDILVNVNIVSQEPLTPSLPRSGPTSARPTWKRASRTPFWPTSS